MGEAEVFIGAHCPTCNITIGVAASVGGPVKCPGCGKPMIAAGNNPEVHSIANVACSKCGTRIGLMTVVGGPAKCPSCGAPLS